ncbi:hypothetical protein L1987_11187 [Smallanthus sonchifolius]|uniref:Uncharacterized protein n=1 Tax=Smallanthus sonchifolius TaxID=185202 RepID=A0ACB9JB74_9ASTR|nr:hypothetical protein L1987_11187 [Smallanthus sonchifolius]
MIVSDASCSYANGGTTKKNVEVDELGVFGAEKYFKGVTDEEVLRTSNNGVRYHPNRPQEEHTGVPCRLAKSKTVSSVRSDSSWNSRRGLLVSNGNNQSKKTSFRSWLASLACNCNDKVKQPSKGGDLGQKASFRSLLANLGCNCNHKDSVKITEIKQPVKGSNSGQKIRSLSSRWADEDVNIRREDCFTFPVLNPSMVDTKHPKPLEVEQEHEGKRSFGLERKLTMLNLNIATPKAEVLESSRNAGQNDTGSDASSDLFELESFTTNENNSFLAQQETENNGYAPSEASVDWSVVTASVSDFSAPQDLTVSTKQRALSDGKVSSGILSRCTSLKAVRVSGDEEGVISGGDKAAVVVSPARREWCHRLDSATLIAKIQEDNRLIGAGSDLHKSQIGVRVARSVHHIHSTHASNHSYMQQK